jgi:hypothetical protein
MTLSHIPPTPPLASWPSHTLDWKMVQGQGWFKVHAKISVMALTPSPLSVIMTLTFLKNSLEVSPKRLGGCLVL